VDPYDAAVAYVTFSGYRYDTHLAHVYRTTNYGLSWDDISSNLPEVPVNVIVVDPQNTTTLYIGTDYGVYYTTDVGVSWQPLGTGLPFSAVDDLVLHDGTRVLRAATHGRSFFEFDLDQLGIEEQVKIIDGGVEIISLQVATPIRNELKIIYTISKAGPARMSIYDVTGRKVEILLDGAVAAGRHEVTKTANLPAGTYFVRLEAQDRTASRKIEIVR
jgi:hypothetical protein